MHHAAPASGGAATTPDSVVVDVAIDTAMHMGGAGRQNGTLPETPQKSRLSPLL